MKKYFVLVQTCLLAFCAFSQTYRGAFDRLENQIYETYLSQLTQPSPHDFSVTTQVASDFNLREGPLMQSYFTMYYATKDLHYLDKLIIHMLRVQDRRDDNM